MKETPTLYNLEKEIQVHNNKGGPYTMLTPKQDNNSSEKDKLE